MKTNTRSLTSVFAAFALTALPTAAVFAQSPPPPPPPPPQQGAQPPAPPHPPQPPHMMMMMHPGSHEPVTFLGVVTVPPPRVLTEQLNVPPGYGLVVESVVPDSPAAAAGIQRYDLLQMFNDQKLVAVEQLATLVHGTPDNTSVSLTLLRKGQPQTVNAKLVRRPPPSQGDENGPRRGRGGGPGGMSGGPEQDWFHLGPHDFFHGFGGGGDNESSGPGRRQIIIRHGDRGRSTTIDGENSRMIISDESGTVELTYQDGKPVVTVRRANGEEVFSGPVVTEEDRKKLPPEALAKLDQLSRAHRDAMSRWRENNNNAARGNDDEDSDFIFEDRSSRPENAPSS
ncbi:MAG: PDZ domain-containing protein [Verrucomicrobia bacterium]|nr:PDZ domain-containing protein [Verrucomicrobiota bacterium]